MRASAINIDSAGRVKASVAAALLVFAFACAFLCVPAPAFAAEGPAVLSTGAPGSSDGLEPGTYYIQSTLSGKFMLDVAGGSKANGANAQLWTANGSAAQRWIISRNADGSWAISNEASGRPLAAASASKGANVRQGSGAQRWALTRSGSAWTLGPAGASSLVLDVKGGRAAKGGNAQLWSANGSAAQRWLLLPAQSSVKPAGRAIADGLYQLRLSGSSSLVLDVKGGSAIAGGNVQLWRANSTAAQLWELRLQSDGLYMIVNANSGMALDVAGAQVAARANVQQWRSNGSRAQRWAISRNADETYTLVNAGTGLALDVAGASAGANAQTWPAHTGASQRFELVPAHMPVPDGLYELAPAAAASLRTDVPGASAKAGTRLQLWTANGSMAQKLRFRRNTDGTCSIQVVQSGLYLADEGGKVVQRKRDASAAAQRWRAGFDRGQVFVNVATGKRLAASASSKGSPLSTAASSTSALQRWTLLSTALLPAGTYTLASAGGKLLEVMGGSAANCANVQVGSATGSGGQVFTIKPSGGGCFTITNTRSGKLVDVAGGSKSAGTNVQQYRSNGTDAQKWKPDLALEGGIVFTNKKSGLVLEAAGSGKSNGGNVRQAARNDNAGQRWMLKTAKPLGISGNAELDNYLRKVVDQTNGELYKCYKHTFTHRSVHELDSRILGHGIQSDAITTEYALMVIRRGQSDCYGKASLFTWLARACGYHANFRAGGAWSASAGEEPHGWTEVYADGKTYVCDPSLGSYFTQYNWYMITYESAHTEYIL